MKKIALIMALLLVNTSVFATDCFDSNNAKTTISNALDKFFPIAVKDNLTITGVRLSYFMTDAYVVVLFNYPKSTLDKSKVTQTGYASYLLDLQCKIIENGK